MIKNLNDTEYRENVAHLRSIIKSDPHYAAILTFGCQQNEADSEVVKGIVSDAGYILTDNTDIADLIIVNTCTIREHAQMKALSTIGRFKALKKKKPDLVIGVIGCMAAEPVAADMLKTDFHYVSFTLQPGMYAKIPELILKNLELNKRSFILGITEPDIEEGIAPVRSAGHKAWVSIMYGCNNFCSYCIVPYVRGRERSRASAAVIAECKSLADAGVKEITLLGQNVNSYASDMDFPKLLRNIASIEGDFIIRFMTSHPKDVSDELIDVIAESGGKIAPYFHLPLQSGSDRILSRMNRTYNVDRFLSIVDKLRAKIPGISISTDIIVGFPGESEEDFEGTLDVVRKVRFDMAYCFMYSVRAGTRAARMKDQIDEKTKSDRIARLLDIQTAISLEKNEHLLGKRVRVLIDSLSKKKLDNTYSARTDTNKLVHLESEKDIIGQFVTVEIEKIGAFDLYGKICE